MANQKPRTLSGMQPTGALHIGNYLGALKNFVAMQHEYEAYFMIADLHSLTETLEPAKLRQHTVALAAAYMAAGVDPKKATIFLQSFIPAHTELNWIFVSGSPMGELERMTQYKDKAVRQVKNINAGLFTYPCLMAADILLYKPNVVPVGDDQKQHVELTRFIARKFNRDFGDTFPEPEFRPTKTPRIMSLADPTRKMSKSEPKGCLFLTDDPATIKKKISRAVTDTGENKKGMSAGVKNLFDLFTAFGDAARVADFTTAQASGTLKYSDLKTELTEVISTGLADFRGRYADLLKKPEDILDILRDGSLRAEKIANTTMLEVRNKVGLPSKY